MSARILIACVVLAGACARGDDLRITPDRGGVRGGTKVRIEGHDFLGHGPVTIHVGRRSARAVVIESSWLITIMTQEVEDPGVVALRIEFADGTVREIPNAFTYEKRETVELVAPNHPSG